MGGGGPLHGCAGVVAGFFVEDEAGWGGGLGLEGGLFFSFLFGRESWGLMMGGLRAFFQGFFVAFVLV